MARFLELLDRKSRAPTFDRTYADVIAPMQIRRTEADPGAYATRFNLTKERAFQQFAGAFQEPMSGRVASAHLPHTGNLSEYNRKFISGSVRADLQDLRGIESAVRRIVVRSAPHSRTSRQAHGKRNRKSRYSSLRLDGEAEQSDGPGSYSDHELQAVDTTYSAVKENSTPKTNLP